MPDHSHAPAFFQTDFTDEEKANFGSFCSDLVGLAAQACQHLYRCLNPSLQHIGDDEPPVSEVCFIYRALAVTMEFVARVDKHMIAVRASAPAPADWRRDHANLCHELLAKTGMWNSPVVYSLLFWR